MYEYQDWIDDMIEEIKAGLCPYCEERECTIKINESTYKCTNCDKLIGVNRNFK